MAKVDRPIKLQFARKLFRMLFDAIDLLTIEYRSHFKQRMKERNISFADLDPVFKHGRIDKEFLPDERDPDFRWSLVYNDITLIFKFPQDGQIRILFKTCWRGKLPKGEKP